MFKAALAVMMALTAFSAEAQQIVKCVGKDGKTYVGSTLPPQCSGQAVDQLNKDGQVVKRTEAMLTPEQRAAKEGDLRLAREKEEEAARKDKEETRKNKALLSTYGSEKDIDIARSRALADNEGAVKETQAKIDVVKGRMIKNYGYCDICSTDVLNYVASIFARGDIKD